MKKTLAVLLLFLSSGATGGFCAEPVTVLDLHHGSFRAFMGWRTTTLIDKDGKIAKPDAAHQSTGPGKEWAQPDFDDTDWLRPRRAAKMNAYRHAQETRGDWNRVWLRGCFTVSNPSAVRGLKLKLEYRGGVVAYVNGREVCRAHLPKGELGDETVAEVYPEAAYLRPDGKVIGRRDSRKKGVAERIKMRDRSLKTEASADGVIIPAKLLRKGLNVLAVESRGAPIRSLIKAGRSWAGGLWGHAGILAARLECGSANGLVPNIAPSPDISIGNVSPVATLFAEDYVLPAPKLYPVRIAGPRNGSFSGRLVLSSSKTMTGLSASASELKNTAGKGTIPVSAVLIRWSAPASKSNDWVGPGRFDALLKTPPAEVEPVSAKYRGQKVSRAPAAVAPVWITVRVPRDAPAGDYRGTVTIAARGGKGASFKVPLELKVFDWTLPDPKDFTLIFNVSHSPDGAAMRYKQPLWSEKHFQTMAKSLGLLAQVGCRICILNLGVKAHSHGNSESIVRWIKQPDGTYKYDFTLAEKYMDLYEKTVGKPRILRVNCWFTRGTRKHYPQVAVTARDAAGKRLPDMLPPADGTPESEKFWRPVLTELRKRIEKRGWWDVTCLGWLNYCNPPDRTYVDVAMKIWPDACWLKNAHGPNKIFRGTDGSMPVKYAAWVWGCGRLYDPDSRKRYKSYPRPWAQKSGVANMVIPRTGTSFTKPGLYDHSPLMRLRAAPEATLQGNIRGFGNVGGEFWPLPVGTRGRFDTLCRSYGAVSPREQTKALIAAGPEGPVFSERMEAMREGIQVYEAMVFMQKALAAKKVSAALAKKIADLLDDRARSILRNEILEKTGTWDGNLMTREATAWRRLDQELFALAEEVARASR